MTNQTLKWVLIALFISINNDLRANGIILANPFLGMWTIDIDGGGVGWLEVHEKNGFLDADLLWIGGSVLPVAHVYIASDGELVVTRLQEVIKSTNGQGLERKHTITNTLRMSVSGDKLEGTMTTPDRQGVGEDKTNFSGKRLPPVGPAPDLTKVRYDEPVQLFTGNDLSGWKLIDPEHTNGFKAVDGILVNDPLQPEAGEHIHYGNLRTISEFEDFNLQLEVNVPEGNNSGIYLRGMYEVQVLDSYGEDLNPHHMGAIYSRIAPSVAAEKPAGSWQSLDIILCQRYVTVKLNGKLIIDNQPLHGPTGGAIISDVFSPGPIYLQGDHGKVSYRNMVLRPIL